jgi:hypothetical protein
LLNHILWPHATFEKEIGAASLRPGRVCRFGSVFTGASVLVFIQICFIQKSNKPEYHEQGKTLYLKER